MVMGGDERGLPLFPVIAVTSCHLLTTPRHLPFPPVTSRDLLSPRDLPLVTSRMRSVGR